MTCVGVRAEFRALDDEQVRGVFREALVMKQLSHDNILNILGLAIMRNQPHIVMPYMHNGDLKTFISRPDKVRAVPSPSVSE